MRRSSEESKPSSRRGSQENVIVYLVEGKPQGCVVVSTSCGADFSDLNQSELDASAIVKPDDGDVRSVNPTGALSVPLPIPLMPLIQNPRRLGTNLQ